MSLQITKTDLGYKVNGEIVVPQAVEFVFETVEQAVEKFKELEVNKAATEPEAPTEPVA